MSITKYYQRPCHVQGTMFWNVILPNTLTGLFTWSRSFNLEDFSLKMLWRWKDSEPMPTAMMMMLRIQGAAPLQFILLTLVKLVFHKTRNIISPASNNSMTPTAFNKRIKIFTMMNRPFTSCYSEPASLHRAFLVPGLALHIRLGASSTVTSTWRTWAWPTHFLHRCIYHCLLGLGTFVILRHYISEPFWTAKLQKASTEVQTMCH